MSKVITFFLSPYCGFSKTTWKIMAAGFINSTGLTLTLYLTLYLDSLGYTVTQIGLTVTFWGMGGLLGGYLGGYLADTFTPLKICKISLLLNTLFLFFLPLIHHFYSLNILAVLLGLANSLFRPAFILLLAQGENASDLTNIIALRRVAINLGMAGGAAIFGFLASVSFILLFWVNAIMGLLAYFLLSRINDFPVTSNSIQQDNAAQNTQNLYFYFILLLMFAVLLVFNQNQIIYPLFLKNEWHVSIHFLSLLFTLNGILIVLFQLPITHALNRYNSRIICASGTFFIGAGFAILTLSHTPILLAIFSCILWTVGEMIFFPPLLVLVLNLSGSQQGKSIGLYQFFFSLALLISPAFGTLCYSHDKNILWYLSGIMGIITSLSFLLNTKNPDFNNQLSLSEP